MLLNTLRFAAHCLKKNTLRIASIPPGLLAVALLGGIPTGAGAQTTWQGVNPDVFSQGNNWSSGVPSATVAGIINLAHSGTSTLTLTSSTVLGDLTLGDVSATDPGSFVLTGSAITFNKTGGNALVKQGGARDIIANALTLGTALNVNVQADSGGLELRGAIGAGTVTKTGGGRLVISGVANNTLNLLNVQQGTVELAKTSTALVRGVTGAINVGGATVADSGTLLIGGTYAGTGSSHLAGFRDQITQGAIVTLNAFGTLDMGGVSEGISQLLGTGKVTNSVAGSTSILQLGDGIASATSITFGGVIEDGAGTVSLVKAGSGTISLTGASTFTGEMVVSTGFLNLSGANGSVQADVVRINRGTLLLDNSASNNQNRIKDTATVVLTEGGISGSLQIRRNNVAGTTTQEKIGTLDVQNGHNVVRFDHSSGANTAGIVASTIILEMDNYTRGTGGTVAFTEFATPVASTTSSAGTPAPPPSGYVYFSTTDPAGANTLTKIILNTLPSQWLVGGTGSTQYNKKVLIGAFGNTEENSVTNRFGNRLMTVQTVNGINYIRPLDKSEFREIGGGATTATITTGNLITPTGTISPDDNIRITGVPGTASTPLAIRIGVVDNQLAGHIAFNSWWQETEALKPVAGPGSNVRIADYNVVHLGGYAGDALNAATTSGSGTMLFNGGLVFPITVGSSETASGNSKYATAYIRGGTLDFGSREAILYLDVTNAAHIYSTISGSGGLTKTGGGQAHLYGNNTYSGVTTHAFNELWVYNDNALGKNGVGNEMINYATFLLVNGINVGSVFDETQKKDLILKAGTFYAAGAKSNSWNGNVYLDNVSEAGEPGSLVFDIRANANLIINGDITGRGSLNPSLYTATTSGRALTIYNEGTGATNNRSLNGIFVHHGVLSDYEGRAALEAHEKLNLRFAGNSLATVITHNKFNAFFEDATKTNPYVELSSGYIHFKKGLGVDNSALGNTYIRNTDANVGTGYVDRANTISALLLGEAGAAYRSAIFTYGASGSANASFVTYSSNSTSLLGGENTSGTVTFGNSNRTSTFTFAMNNTQDTKTKSSGWTNLKVDRTPGAAAASGSFVLTMDTTGITAGMIIEGAGIPVGTKVAQVDFFNGQVYLTAATSATVNTSTSLKFYELSNKVVLTDVTNLQVGMGITGTGIRAGTTIIAIDAVTREVTLSAPLTSAVTAATSITFSVPKVVVSAGVNKIQNFGEVRLYQNAGGNVEFLTSFVDVIDNFRTDGAIAALTKVGRGTAILKGGATSSDVNGGLNVLGGGLVLDYSGRSEGFSHVSGNGVNQLNPYQLTLGGAELRLVNDGSNSLTNTENLRGVLTLRAGNSTVTLDPGDEKSLILNLGLNNTAPRFLTINVDGVPTFVNNPNWYWRAPDRFAGATVNFFADTTVRGSANFYYSQYAPDGAAIADGAGLGSSTIIPYSTFKYRDETGKLYVDFASFLVDNLGNTRIVDAAGYIASSANLYNANGGAGAANVGNWGTYLATSTGYFTDGDFGGSTGFSGTLVMNSTSRPTYYDFVGAKSIRFASSANSTINIGDAFNRLVLGSDKPGSFMGAGATTADGGAILISNSVGAFNSRITGGSITSALGSSYFKAAVAANSMTDAPAIESRDLIIHNYNTLGTFTLDSVVVDFTENYDFGDLQAVTKLNLVVAGPGTTILTKDNTHSGITYVSGGEMNKTTGVPDVGTLRMQSVAALGTSNVFLNGGRLQFAHLTTPATSLGSLSFGANRNLTLGGNGGFIDVAAAGSTLTIDGFVRSDDNILSGNTAANQMSANPAVGDLIKEGLGKLILTKSAAIPTTFATTANSLQTWNAYYGLTTVKAGILQVNIGAITDSGILGSNDSSIDGTVVETGGRLDVMMTANTASTKEWITLNGGTLGTATGHTDGIIDGVLTLGSAGGTIDVSGVLRLNANEGYVTGSGTLVKTGSGTLFLYQNNVNFTGNIDIRAGRVNGYTQGLPFGSGSLITLGGITETSGDANLYLYANLSSTAQYRVAQNIVVRANSGTQVRNIGAGPIGSGRNQDSFIFDGGITFNGNANLTFTDSNTSASLLATAGDLQSSHVTGAYRNLIFNGDFSGTGNVSTSVLITGAGTYGAKATFLLNGNNSAWTGNMNSGNAALNNLQEHFLRMGSNLALTAANKVALSYNTAFQLGGKSVSIGDLSSLATGTAAANKTYVENAANDEGTLRVVQTAHAEWNILFQDGVTPEWYTNATAVVYSNRLNLTKAGVGTAVLTQANTYTGNTVAEAGNLQVGKGGDGTRASADTVGRSGTGSLRINGGTVSGTGVVQGRSGIVHEINSGGKLAPGDTGGDLRGTLFIDGGLKLNSGGVIELQITTSTFNVAGLSDAANTSVYSAALLALPSNAALANPIALTMHDHLEVNGQMDLSGGGAISVVGLNFSGATAGDVFNLIDWTSVNSAGFSTGGIYRFGGEVGSNLLLPLLNNGLQWDTSLFTSHGILVATVVPEPSRMVLLLLGLCALTLRRKRR